MKRTRREFLKTAGAASMALPLASLGCGDGGPQPAGADAAADAAPADPGPAPIVPDDLPPYEYDGPLGPETLFQHGVASGDPTSEAVILWTRASSGAAGEVAVWWEIAVDEAFVQRVAVGTATAGADRDHTVKVDATGLSAATTYWYRFKALGRTSPVGRTRTAPSGPTAHLSIAVASCAKYTSGYFAGYRRIAEKDVDVVLHLGDYIYESGVAGEVPGRNHEPPHDPVTRDEYRTRYGYYRLDPDLQEAHRRHPWIVVWDDHETANNSWKGGAEGHDEATQGSWADRRAAGTAAYLEWLPIREQADGRIWRRFAFGDLVDLLMLDTRLWGRDEQKKEAADLSDPTRTLLGDDQEQWLAKELADSTATWRVLGQQVMMAPLLAAGVAFNNDQWDGYPAARDRLYATIDELAIDNLVVLAGDIHSSWASELPRTTDEYDAETGAGSIAVEFVTPGITSLFPLSAGLVDLALSYNPHVKYGEVTSRGYIVLDVTASRVEATWHHFESVASADAPEVKGATFRSEHGSRRLTRIDG